jgi:hypothetical protein
MRYVTPLLLAAATLAGCGATVKASSPRSVVIHAPGVQSAQKLADEECAKHKRFAEFQQQRPEFVYTFRCVE